MTFLIPACAGLGLVLLLSMLQKHMIGRTYKAYAELVAAALEQMGTARNMYDHQRKVLGRIMGGTVFAVCAVLIAGSCLCGCEGLSLEFRAACAVVMVGLCVSCVVMFWRLGCLNGMSRELQGRLLHIVFMSPRIDSHLEAVKSTPDVDEILIVADTGPRRYGDCWVVGAGDFRGEIVRRNVLVVDDGICLTHVMQVAYRLMSIGAPVMVRDLKSGEELELS